MASHRGEQNVAEAEAAHNLLFRICIAQGGIRYATACLFKHSHALHVVHRGTTHSGKHSTLNSANDHLLTTCKQVADCCQATLSHVFTTLMLPQHRNQHEEAAARRHLHQHARVSGGRIGEASHAHISQPSIGRPSAHGFFHARHALTGNQRRKAASVTFTQSLNCTATLRLDCDMSAVDLHGLRNYHASALRHDGDLMVDGATCKGMEQ
mmetsp:Transcript_17398/g.44541  ORF Transcript_17398/g.44541 Transcript_17398/m.44541 type:complete len:210 (-) Transcript_17398:529-1158(-)